jgi:predicted transcriptional regulator
MSGSESLNFRLRSDLKRQANILAQQDDRSLSNWIRLLIQTEVKNSAVKNADFGLVADDNLADQTETVKRP